jgi:hypothetical protein
MEFHLHIHHHHHDDSDLDVLTAIHSLKQEIKKMALSLDALTQAVADEKTVEDSAIALLGGLTSKINDLIAASGNSVDPAALQAIVDELNTNKAALSAAVVLNTPASPAPPSA